MTATFEVDEKAVEAAELPEKLQDALDDPVFALRSLDLRELLVMLPNGLDENMIDLLIMMLGKWFEKQLANLTDSQLDALRLQFRKREDKPMGIPS